MRGETTDRETRTLPRLQQALGGGEQMPGHAALLARGPISQGTPLGRYIVLYRIGSGGMGEVYAAYDPQLDRKVAVKLLRSDMARQLGEATRREASALARLVHPNVVTVFDFGEAAGRPFICMEFIAGRTLKEWLADELPSQREIIEVFVAAGRGLAAAHAVGLVHRDFKPSNVMLSADGDVKVLDFGLAFEASDDGELDEATRWLGTPSYMAPERQDGHRGDTLSDQYSFCAALYEALTGQCPAPTDGQPSRFGEDFAIGQVAVGLPRGIRRPLQRGLARRSEDRFVDLPQLLQNLAPAKTRRGVFAAAVVILAGALVLGQARSDGPRCDSGSAKLAELWGSGQKSRIETAFLATGAPFAADSWRRIETALDRYTSSWQAMHVEACEATHVRGEQSAVLLDRRMLCLDHRLQELHSLTRLLLDADIEAVSQAGSAVTELSSISHCADRERLTQVAPQPDEPALRARVAGLQQVAADQLVKFHLGKRPDLEALEDAAARARELGYPPLEGEISYVLGKLQRVFAADGSVTEETFIQALAKAIEGRDNQLQVRVYTGLAETIGRRRPEDGLIWERLGRAALAAIGPGYHELAYELESAAGLVDWSAGRRRLGVEHFSQALSSAEQVWGSDHPKLARAIGNLGIVGRGPGLVRAIAILEQAYGSDNPLLATHLVNLGANLARDGSYEAALKHARRADLVVAEAYGDDNRERRVPLTLLGQILMAADRPWEAERALREALALVSDPARELKAAADLEVSLAKALHLQGRDREAWPYVERALAAVGPGVAVEDPLSIEVLIVGGGVARELGKLKQAEGYHARARRSVATTESDLQRGELLVEAAETLLALRRSAAAVPLLEEGLDRVRPRIDRGHGARLRFALARALSESEPIRSRDLAAAAVAVLDSENRMHQQLRHEIVSFFPSILQESSEELSEGRSV